MTVFVAEFTALEKEQPLYFFLLRRCSAEIKKGKKKSESERKEIIKFGTKKFRIEIFYRKKDFLIAGKKISDSRAEKPSCAFDRGSRRSSSTYFNVLVLQEPFQRLAKMCRNSSGPLDTVWLLSLSLYHSLSLTLTYPYTHTLSLSLSLSFALSSPLSPR